MHFKSDIKKISMDEYCVREHKELISMGQGHSLVKQRKQSHVSQELLNEMSEKSHCNTISQH
jgi:hypothetical protein